MISTTRPKEMIEHAGDFYISEFQNPYIMKQILTELVESREIINGLMESYVIKSALFYGHSEAILNVKDHKSKYWGGV